MTELSSIKLAEDFSIGLIQTTLNGKTAWKSSPKMNMREEEWAVYEIRKFISALHQEKTAGLKKKKPEIDIILLPELSIPRGFIPKLRDISNQMQSIIIAGLDYKISDSPDRVSNEAIVVVPSIWRGKKIYARPTVRYVGKTYPAKMEEVLLNRVGYEFEKTPDVWLFDGGDIGSFGVTICFDLLDLDRLAMYRGKIQHLFVLAYNQDTNSFDHVAEAMARMIFCNVVICNCGTHGGSVSVSPYKEVFKRTIFRHSGPNLGTAQVIKLPVASLVAHQENSNHSGDFKSLPPGYISSIVHVEKKDIF